MCLTQAVHDRVVATDEVVQIRDIPKHKVGILRSLTFKGNPEAFGVLT